MASVSINTAIECAQFSVSICIQLIEAREGGEEIGRVNWGLRITDRVESAVSINTASVSINTAIECAQFSVSICIQLIEAREGGEEIGRVNWGLRITDRQDF